MNSVKITYLICDLISSLAILAVAVIAPIWVTPGYYWWTLGCVIFEFMRARGFTSRLNGWAEMGNVE